MGYIPNDARWYLADLVLEHRIEGDRLNVVHVNTHLVEAGPPQEAYEKSLALGRGSELDYENTDGRWVRVVFRGLRELNVIYESLEDGTEIMYSEDVDVPEDQLRGWVKPRERLGVFAPVDAKNLGPNYLPSEFKPLMERQGRGEAVGIASLPVSKIGTGGRVNMNQAIDHWKSQLITLSPGDRVELAHFLLSSLEPEDEGVEAAWDAEALRRADEIRSGRATGRPVDDFLGELRERYP